MKKKNKKYIAGYMKVGESLIESLNELEFKHLKKYIETELKKELSLTQKYVGKESTLKGFNA